MVFFLFHAGEVDSLEVEKPHQPLTRRYPLDKFDDEVDVGHFLKILRHQIQSVVEAPQTMNINASSQVDVVVGIDDLDELVGQSVLHPNHVGPAVGRYRDQL